MQMCRLICSFVICMQQSQVFLHRLSHCVVSLSETLYLLLSSGSTFRKTGNRPNMTEKLLTSTSSIKTNKQTNKTLTIMFQLAQRERSGSVVECLTRDRGVAGSSLTSVTALCPWARHINPSLVLVQPRKTRPYITERLLMGRKESNQIKSTGTKRCIKKAIHMLLVHRLSTLHTLIPTNTFYKAEKLV